MIRALKGPENMILSEKQAQKDIVGIMKAFLELDKETQKADILIRFAIDAARKNLDFENIYNNFIKLYFTNTNYAAMFEKWDKFKEAVNFIAQNKTEVASLISEIAIIAGKNALLEEIETNPAAEDVINASLKLVRPKKEELEVAQEVLVATRATLLNDFIDLSKTNGFIQQIQKSRMSQESGYLNKTGFRYTKTWHKQQIDAINETFAQAQASLEAMESSEYTEDDVKTIQKLIDLSDLEAYIQNIGPTIDAEKVMSQLDRALLSRDTTIIRKFIDFTQERVARFNRQYDTKLTGLPTRFKFYEQSNALVTEAENTGENHSIYFVDLGYLGGYFNKKGNRATGDEALAVAVSQIEQKLAEYFGNESWQEAVQVFRYGGDELMLTVRNGNESAVLIQKLFLELNAQGEKVKAVGRVGPTYVPERIQYNAARCDVNLGKKILQEMIGKEIFSPEEEKMLSDDYMNREFYVKTLARVMTTTADKYCSYRKTYDRFEKLWADYIAITKAEEKGENMEKEREHLRDMLDASSKALEGVDFDIFEQCSNYIAVHNKATGWEAFTTVLESYNKGKNLLKSVEDIESGKFNEITERLIEDMVKDAGARRKVMEQRVSTIV
jgi:GGDEF domain-containing protein